MRLKSVIIHGFRSITHLELHPEPLTTLIGKNSAGKSNILLALKCFFTASKTGDSNDICKLASHDGTTWIECLFVDLSEHERIELSRYVHHDGSIRVRRTLSIDGEKCVTKLQGYVESPTEPWLQEEYAAYADMNAWNALNIDVTEYAELGASGRLTQAGYKKFREEYVRRHAGDLSYVSALSDSEFKGRQSTAAACLPHFVFVPAIGDIASVIYGKQSSLLNEIVGAVIESGKSLPIYQQAQEGLTRAQDLVNPSGSRLEKLAKIEEDLVGRLSAWPSTKVTIRTQVDELAKLLTSGLVLNIDDGCDCDLGGKGSGIQRQVLFRVFQLYADYRASRGLFAPEAGESPPDRGSSIVAFEEPELFLHPQAQDQFYDDLVAVSAKDQVLLATHSSHLVKLQHAAGIRIVHRYRADEPSQMSSPSMDWVDASDQERFKEIDLCAGEISRVFFADKVVIVEGDEDVVYVNVTADRYANCFDRGVTVVQVGGNESIPRLQRILNALAIPYVVACDRDPGKDKTASVLVEIKSLVDAARDCRGQGAAGLEVFDPDLPSVCHGTKPSGPYRSKAFNAVHFFRANKPTDGFVDRVRVLFQKH